jgi:hypothetical protein
LQAAVRWDHVALAGLALGATVWLALNLRLLSFRIDQPEIGLDYAMGILWWSLIAFGLACVKGEDQPLLMKAWVVKFFVVLIFMLFYEQRYGLDANWYFKVTVTGEHPHYLGVDWRKEWFLFQDPFEGRVDTTLKKKLSQGTDNMIRLVMLLSTFTGPYYSALKVVFAFFGLLGSWAFYRAVVVTLGRPVPVAFYWLAFSPSILFWSSILGKDPLMFLFLGVCAYGAARTLIRGEPIGIPIIAVALFLAYNTRTWTAMMAGGTLIAALFFRRGYALQRLALILVAIAVVTIGWEPVKDAFHIDDLSSVEALFITLTEGQTAKSEWTVYQAEFGGGQGTAGAEEIVAQIQSGNVGSAIPIIIFSGLFRPLPFEARNAFMVMSGLENACLLVLVLLAIKRFRRTYFQEPLVIWPIFLSLLWATFYGAVLLANFGAGVRYKLQVLPFMMIFLFLVLHPDGLTRRDGRGAKSSADSASPCP